MNTRYTIAACPACGGTEHVEIAGADEVRAEIEELWSFHTRRLAPQTPPRMLFDRTAFSQRPPLRLAQCTGCSMLFRNPREHVETLDDVYADEEPDASTLQALHDNQRTAYAAQARRLTRLAGRTGTGLEVGSYVGAFLAAARDEGWVFDGVDINPTTNSFTAGLGFDVVTGGIEDVPDTRRYDAVSFWNCFDQLPDPASAAHEARRRVAQGGFLAVRVPNGAFYVRWRRRLHGPLRRAARAALAHNNLLSFPYRHGFTAAALRHVLQDAGFRIVHVHGDVLVPIADRWTRTWAGLEERAVKAALRRMPSEHAPWLEVYARAV